MALEFIQESYFEPEIEPEEWLGREKKIEISSVESKLADVIPDPYLRSTILEFYSPESKTLLLFPVYNPLRLWAIRIIESQFVFF